MTSHIYNLYNTGVSTYVFQLAADPKLWFLPWKGIILRRNYKVKDYAILFLQGLSLLLVARSPFSIIFLSSQTSCQEFWVWHWGMMNIFRVLIFHSHILTHRTLLWVSGPVARLTFGDIFSLPLTQDWECGSALLRWMSLSYKRLLVPLCVRTRVDFRDSNPFSFKFVSYLGSGEARRSFPPPFFGLPMNSEYWNLTKPVWVQGSIKPWERKDVIYWNW